MVLCWANFERYQAANRKIAAMFFFNHTVIVQNNFYILYSKLPLTIIFTFLSKKRKDTSSRSTSEACEWGGVRRIGGLFRGNTYY